MPRTRDSSKRKEPAGVVSFKVGEGGFLRVGQEECLPGAVVSLSRGKAERFEGLGLGVIVSLDENVSPKEVKEVEEVEEVEEGYQPPSKIED